MKTFAMRLYGVFGPFIVSAFGSTVDKARQNLAVETRNDPLSFNPECLAEFASLADYHKWEDEQREAK